MEVIFNIAMANLPSACATRQFYRQTSREKAQKPQKGAVAACQAQPSHPSW
jgi:hypothetical protein